MRGLLRVLIVLVFVLAPLSTDLGCKRSGATGAPVQRVPGMPRPLPIPDQPTVAFHVESPHEIVRGAQGYIPGLESETGILEELILDDLGIADLAETVSASVDLVRPWTAARIEDEDIFYLAIRKDAVSGVKSVLDGYPKEGKFGAVRLPVTAQNPRASLPTLAWLDADTSTLTLAKTLRGIATGRELASAYGGDPLFVTADRSLSDTVDEEVPFQRATLRGQGLHDFKIDLEGTEGMPKQLDSITNGALTGMLDGQQIALGASTRWASYKQDVASIISQVQSRVKKQNFLVRGILEDLSRKLNATLRSWNGKVLLGVGPSQHALIGLGADNPKKAETAALRLLRTTIDNLKLASTFGVPVPKASLRKSSVKGGDANMHILTVRKIPQEARRQLGPLLDDKGQLRVAMAFSPRAGGVMVVVGNKAPNVLVRWLESVQKAPAAKQSNEDLLAARIAVKPETLKRLEKGLGGDLLNLQADREPTRLVLRRDGNNLELTVKGPPLDVPRPRVPVRKPVAALGL